MAAVYKYIDSEYVGEEIHMRVLYSKEPDSLDYVKSFFGLFAPYPQTKQHEVVFIKQDNAWVEHSSYAVCSEELSSLLEKFLWHAQNGFVYDLSGII